jgi:hypothetical protein
VRNAAGKTETTQENIQKWFEVDKGEPGFQLHLLSYFLNKRSAMIFIDLYQQYYQHYFYSYILHLFSNFCVF